MIEIFEISLKPVGQIILENRRASVATYLRQTGQPRLGSVAMPVALVHFPEQFVSRPTTKRVWSWTNDAHVSLQNIKQLR